MDDEDYEPEHRAEDSNGVMPFLNSKLYDKLKWVALILLPAFGSAYFGLSTFWDLPKTEEVVGTCSVAGIFIGSLIGLSKKSYENSDAKYDGDVELWQTPEGNQIRVIPNEDVPQIADKKELTLKVQSYRIDG